MGHPAMPESAIKPRPGRRPRKAKATRTRLDASGSVRLISTREPGRLDLYHTVLTVTWPIFFAIFAAVYFFFNVVFAVIFLVDERGIANAKPGSFADAFFFSVETMANVGFGEMHPQDLYTNIVVTIEVLLGLIIIALATACIFARFSRPTARVMFSDVAVIAPYDGVPTLMFRAANQRRNQILEAQVNVSILRDEVTAEGHPMRRFHDLQLARSRSPIFSLSWTVMHPIDGASPLHGVTAEMLAAEDARIIVTLTGLDETLSATIHARHAYSPEDVKWNRRFTDILGEGADGMSVIDYRRFHDVEIVETTAAKSRLGA
jgi:inward rectifier potassium channel